jgi:hypothetical protein
MKNTPASSAAIMTRGGMIGEKNARLPASSFFLLRCMSLQLAVRPEGANHQWRKNPPGELSIDPVADERLVQATAWVGAS